MFIVYLPPSPFIFSWLYRIRPSVLHGALVATPEAAPGLTDEWATAGVVDPNQMRWGAHPMPTEDSSVNFLQGICTKGGGGDVKSKAGMAIYVYSCNTSMNKTAFYNSDGDWLIGMCSSSWTSSSPRHTRPPSLPSTQYLNKAHCTFVPSLAC